MKQTTGGGGVVITTDVFYILIMCLGYFTFKACITLGGFLINSVDRICMPGMGNRWSEIPNPNVQVLTIRVYAVVVCRLFL